MKKKLVWLCLACTAAISLAACGGSDSYSSDYDLYDEYEYEDWDYESSESAEFYDSEVGFDGGTYEGSQITDTSRKLISTVDISGETKEFDSAIDSIRTSVKKLGGYIESSSVSGRSSYYDDYYTRDAFFTVRIPEKNLESFISTVNGACNVTQSSETVEDVTLSYTDTQTHLVVLKAERDKLQEMLLACDTIEDMLTVEARLSEVVAEVEIYESRLRTYDSLISYATVNISIDEVRDYTVISVEPKSIWEEMGDGFMESVATICGAALNVFVFIVSKFPYIVIIAIIVLVVIKVMHADNKRRAAKKEKDYQESRAKLAAQYDGTIIPPEERVNKENK